MMQNTEVRSDEEDLPLVRYVPQGASVRVSVISIALRPEEFTPLIEGLQRQTFQDFEFIGAAGGSIPSAWNRALRAARGEIVVFTETDARPVNENWLEEMVAGLTVPAMIVKGLEIIRQELDFSNLAIPRKVFESFDFDPTFGAMADLELCLRLQEAGYAINLLQRAPVIYLEKARRQRVYRNAFRYGWMWARLRQRYGEIEALQPLAFGKAALQPALRQLGGMVVGAMLNLAEKLTGRNSN